MNKKVVTEAASYQVPRDNSKLVANSLSLLIARDGVLRTDSSQLKWILKPLVEQGVLRETVEEKTHTYFFGDDFEKWLLQWVDTHHSGNYYFLIKEYRQFLVRASTKYECNSSVFSDFTNLLSSDDKFLFLASVLGEVTEKLNILLRRNDELEARLNEIDVGLSVLESADADLDR